MTYADKNMVYAINSYLWKLLSANLGWTTDDYDGGRPIIPSAQQPEFLDKGNTFIVYGSANYPSSHLYQVRRESVAYTIYSPTSTEANRVAGLLIDTFERQDEAAVDVNDWMDTEIDNGKNRGINFLYVNVIMAEKAEPPESEGGMVSAMVVLEVKYTHDDTGVQTSGFTYP